MTLTEARWLLEDTEPRNARAQRSLRQMLKLVEALIANHGAEYVIREELASKLRQVTAS